MRLGRGYWLMSDEILDYVGTDFIKGDLKRLKKWATLEQDIYIDFNFSSIIPINPLFLSGNFLLLIR